MERVDQVPEGYTRTAFPGLYDKAGIHIVTIIVDGGIRHFYVPDWTLDVLAALAGKTLEDSRSIGNKLLTAMNALDDETRNAAMTVLILGGIKALASHVLGNQS